MQSGKYHSPGNHQTQTCPSDCQTEKRDSSLQRRFLHCSDTALHLWLTTCCSSQLLPPFVITPLTVDRGIFNNKEISLTYCTGATYHGTRLNSLNS
ncbi:unnamed protein product [Staurois parvus]|uniref:Uncharacterized protein n=1 Tax=Staurois parvus TaxID=386267 RepID=A0ABN9GNW9_9NEOB|nr:unnamed protein product [Staurois parvus]